MNLSFKNIWVWQYTHIGFFKINVKRVLKINIMYSFYPFRMHSNSVKQIYIIAELHAVLERLWSANVLIEDLG